MCVQCNIENCNCELPSNDNVSSKIIYDGENLNCGNDLDKFISSQIVIKIQDSADNLLETNFKIFDNYIFVKDNKFLILNKENQKNSNYEKNIDINLLYII